MMSIYRKITIILLFIFIPESCLQATPGLDLFARGQGSEDKLQVWSNLCDPSTAGNLFIVAKLYELASTQSNFNISLLEGLVEIDDLKPLIPVNRRNRVVFDFRDDPQGMYGKYFEQGKLIIPFCVYGCYGPDQAVEKPFFDYEAVISADGTQISLREPQDRTSSDPVQTSVPSDLMETGQDIYGRAVAEYIAVHGYSRGMGLVDLEDQIHTVLEISGESDMERPLIVAVHRDPESWEYDTYAYYDIDEARFRLCSDEAKNFLKQRISDLPDGRLEYRFNDLDVNTAVIAEGLTFEYWDDFGEGRGRHRISSRAYEENIYPKSAAEVLSALDDIRADHPDVVVLDIFGGSGNFVERILSDIGETPVPSTFIIEQRESNVMNANRRFKSNDRVKAVQARLGNNEGEIPLAEAIKVNGIPRPAIITIIGGLNEHVTSSVEDALRLTEEIYNILPDQGYLIVSGISMVLLNSKDFEKIGFKVLRTVPPGYRFGDMPKQLYVLKKETGSETLSVSQVNGDVSAGANVSCGTICEKGHQEFLDGHLDEYYGALALRAFQNGMEELDRDMKEKPLSETEVIEALSISGIADKFHTDKKQLTKILEYVHAHGIPGQGEGKIEILFAVPNPGHRWQTLWWIENPDWKDGSGQERYLYAGGHFNKAGTRIHISLPLILSYNDPAKAALDIALHEYNHILSERNGIPSPAHDVSDPGFVTASRTMAIDSTLIQMRRDLETMSMRERYDLQGRGTALRPADIFFMNRPVEEIVASGLSADCDETAYVFCHLMGKQGYQTRIISGAEISMAGYVYKNRGHTIVAVYDWQAQSFILVDPEMGRIVSMDWDERSEWFEAIDLPFVIWYRGEMDEYREKVSTPGARIAELVKARAAVKYPSRVERHVFKLEIKYEREMGDPDLDRSIGEYNRVQDDVLRELRLRYGKPVWRTIQVEVEEETDDTFEPYFSEGVLKVTPAMIRDADHMAFLHVQLPSLLLNADVGQAPVLDASATPKLILPSFSRGGFSSIIPALAVLNALAYGVIFPFAKEAALAGLGNVFPIWMSSVPVAVWELSGLFFSSGIISASIAAGMVWVRVRRVSRHSSGYLMGDGSSFETEPLPGEVSEYVMEDQEDHDKPFTVREPLTGDHDQEIPSGPERSSSGYLLGTGSNLLPLSEGNTGEEVLSGFSAEGGSGLREAVVRDYLRNISDLRELAATSRETFKSYAFSGRKLVIALESGLRGGKLDAERIRRTVEKWKSRMIRACVNDSQKARVSAQLENIVVFSYSGAPELNSKLLSAGIDPDDEAYNYVFAFANDIGRIFEDPEHGRSDINPVVIEEGDDFSEDYYYPIIEIVALALTRELLGLEYDEFMSAIEENGIKLEDLGIKIISADSPGAAGRLLVRILPSIEKYGSEGHRDRMTQLLHFLQSA